MTDEYYCALSGVAPQENQITEEDDEYVGDLPIGWVKITFSRRYPNPKYELIQDVKAAAMEQLLSQIDEKHREQVREALQIQVEAQYSYFEDKLGRYIIDEVTAYVADPASSAELTTEVSGLLESLELDLIDLGIEEVDEEESNEESAEAEVTASAPSIMEDHPTPTPVPEAVEATAK